MNGEEIRRVLAATDVDTVEVHPLLHSRMDGALDRSYRRDRFDRLIGGASGEELGIEIAVCAADPSTALVRLTETQVRRLPAYAFEGGRKGLPAPDDRQGSFA